MLMGYANWMVHRGTAWFAAEAAKAGVDGVICVDLPPEEDAELEPDLRAVGIDVIRLATADHRCEAPPRGAGRLQRVPLLRLGRRDHRQAQAAQPRIEEAVARLKAATDLPVAVGFGVRTPEQAEAIARVADGVVVGSALVEIIGREWATPAALETSTGRLAKAA